MDSLKELLSKDEYDYRYDIGISQPLKNIRFTDKERLVSLMTMHFVVLNVKAELDQLLCGMSSTLNTLELIRGFPCTFRPLFVYSTPPRLTWEKLFEMFPAKTSPEGSNLRELEEAAVMRWTKLLQFC